MVNEIRIPCEDGDIVLNVDYDAPSKCADLVKLDADLKLISQGWLGIGQSGRDAYYERDNIDYSSVQWETPLGKKIGVLFAAIDAGEEV